jgi:AraC family transcriptional regulator
MKLFIKNMVCNRCIMVVKDQLEKNGLEPIEVTLGEIEIKDPVSKDKLDDLNNDLRSLGFELLDDQRQKQIESIKKLLIGLVQSGEIKEHFTLSKYLQKELNREYSQLSRLFSEVEGITIEQFFILQKIEKVKEWLAYNELNLSEITWKLGYSSVAHLSAQFKKITGMTPSQFKKLGSSHRRTLDSI